MEQVHVFTLDTLDPDTQNAFPVYRQKEFVNIPHCTTNSLKSFSVIKGFYVHNINGIEQLLQAGSLVLICPFRFALLQSFRKLGFPIGKNAYQLKLWKTYLIIWVLD